MVIHLAEQAKKLQACGEKGKPILAKPCFAESGQQNGPNTELSKASSSAVVSHPPRQLAEGSVVITVINITINIHCLMFLP